MPDTGSQPSVRVTLDAIYQQGQTTAAKVTELEHTVTKLVAINERLDKHKEDIKNNGLEIQRLDRAVARINVIITIITAGITAVVVKFFTG